MTEVQEEILNRLCPEYEDECWDKSDDTVVEEIIEDYYSSWSDFEDILEGQDFKVTIHD